MKELFLIKDSLANKISYYHLLFLMASLPFDMFYSHLILISFTVHTLIQLTRSQIKPIFTWRNIGLASVLLLTAACTIYSSNKPEAFVEWGRQAIVLLFPLLFCFTRLELKKYRSRLLLGFSLIGTLTVTWLFWDAFHTIRYYGLPLSSITSHAFNNHNFAAPIGMHATFLSMQLTIALVYLISVLINKHNTYARIFYLLCIGMLTAGIFQLSSKSIFFCLFFLINLAVPYFLLKGKSRIRFFILSGSLSLLAIIGVFNIKSFKERLITNLQADLSSPKAEDRFDPRLARWDAAYELIRKSPVIGYGSGTEISLLHEVYFKKKYYNSFLNRLNAHNQYLSFLLKSGIIGLLVYLGTLAFGFKSALANKDMLFFSFMMVITFVSFSENFLDVEKGVIFYAFFFSFFSFSNDPEQAANIQLTIKNEPVEKEYLEELATN
jgi:O-antigen ligase